MSRRILVRIYPRAWRQRYGDEFALLLDATPMTARLVANVLVAAGREWLLRTFVGRCAIGISVSWVANVIAGYLAGAFPVEPYIEYRGFRWAPWPSYFGLITIVVLVGACFRYYTVVMRNDKPVSSVEFGFWIVAFLAASVGSQWSDIARDPHLTAFELWKTNALMLSGQFGLLLIASKQPQAKTSTAAPVNK